jgi:hypothetical protein
MLCGAALAAAFLPVIAATAAAPASIGAQLSQVLHWNGMKVASHHRDTAARRNRRRLLPQSGGG